MAAATSPYDRLSQEEVALAGEGARVLAQFTRGRPRALQISVARNAPPIELPPGVVRLLQAMLADIASGRPVQRPPLDAELTTQQAADHLNVSRPYLVRLLERKEMPFRLVGTHRRIRSEDVVRYKQDIERERRKVLERLAAAKARKMRY
jgi:excisionase family DNA binding protein